MNRVIVNICKFCNNEFTLNYKSQIKKYCCRNCFYKDRELSLNKLKINSTDNNGNYFCKVCNKYKPSNLFYKNIQKYRGLEYQCKECKNNRCAERRKNIKIAVEKICAKCKLLKSINCFPNDNFRLGGKSSYCYECTSCISIDKYYKDIKIRLRYIIRSRMCKKLRCKINKDKFNTLLGCDLDKLIRYIELKFIDDMTWKNYGLNGWTVDHILPLAAFNLKDDFEQQMAFHYTNLQPMWAKQNFSKRDIYDSYEVNKYKQNWLFMYSKEINFCI